MIEVNEVNEVADTRAYRRATKKRGQYGTDWYKYYTGVPPEDDDNDYEWTGSVWQVIYHD